MEATPKQQQQQQQQQKTSRFTEDIRKPTFEGEFRQIGQSLQYDFQGFYLHHKTATRVSPWHDLPLFISEGGDGGNGKGDGGMIVNFINEIPKGSRRKYEIRTDEEWNPIMQDKWKDGTLRYYKYGNSLVNYGALPQTWEDPDIKEERLGGLGGDGDPIDVVEIGERIMPIGLVYEVKVLGVLALLDDGEVDWKVIAINVEDEKVEELNEVEDVFRVIPGRIEDVREWFKMYKTAEGKGVNEYGFDGRAMGREFAEGVVREGHRQYMRLVMGKRENDEGLWLGQKTQVTQEEKKEA